MNSKKKKHYSDSNNFGIEGTDLSQTSDSDFNSSLSIPSSSDSEIKLKSTSKRKTIKKFNHDSDSYGELNSSQSEPSFKSTPQSESDSGIDQQIRLEPDIPSANESSSSIEYELLSESTTDFDFSSDPPDSSSDDFEIEKIIGINQPTFDESLNQLMFYIKYKNKSYRSCQWVDKESFFHSENSKMMYEIFIKNPTPFRPVPFFNQTVSMSFDDGIGFKLFKPSRVDFNEGFVTPEKILSIRTSMSEKKYLVKWLSLDITESTWETDVPDELICEYEESNFLIHSRCYDHSENQNMCQFVEFENSPIFKNENELTDFQVEGLNWLEYCWFESINSILADETGLGKTIESISIIQILSNWYTNWGPFLIVCPLSKIPNWLEELKKWTNFRVVCMIGNDESNKMIKKYLIYQRDNEKGTLDKEKIIFDVMVISYEILSKEMNFIKSFNFMYTIIDEAQRIKNFKTNIYKDCMSIQSFHKLLMTGTPIENNLYELFSLLHFVDPSNFSDFDAFKRDTDSIEKIQEVIRPYILRRKKNDVHIELHEKEEIIIDVEMTRIQRHFSQLIIKNNIETLKNSFATKVNLNDIVMQLQKLFCHPFLIPQFEDVYYSKYKKLHEIPNSTKLDPDEEMDSLISSSGKTILIDKLLPKLREENHKVLIFSQMLKMLDIIEDYLVYKGYFYERLDDSCNIAQRNVSINRFQTDDNVFVLLLLTRAGEVGINLKCADTVIIYDGDWNPKNDIQAQSRLHRIGQTKKVNIYRLITRGCYESEMFLKASKKHDFDFTILDPFENTQFNDDELRMQSRFELQTILRKGAYYTFNDDPNEIDKFCFENIEQILEHRCHTRSDLIGGENSKGSFDAEIDDDDDEINKQDFWNDLVAANQASDSNDDDLSIKSKARTGKTNKTRKKKKKNVSNDFVYNYNLKSSSSNSNSVDLSDSSSSYYSDSDNDFAPKESDEADNEDEDNEMITAVPDDYDDNMNNIFEDDYDDKDVIYVDENQNKKTRQNASINQHISAPSMPIQQNAAPAASSSIPMHRNTTTATSSSIPMHRNAANFASSSMPAQRNATNFATASSIPMHRNAPTFAPSSSMPMQQNVTNFAPSSIQMQQNATDFATASSIQMNRNAPNFAPSSSMQMQQNATNFATASSMPMHRNTTNFAPSSIPMHRNAPTFTTASSIPMQQNAPTYAPSSIPMHQNTANFAQSSMPMQQNTTNFASPLFQTQPNACTITPSSSMPIDMYAPYSGYYLNKDSLNPQMAPTYHHYSNNINNAPNMNMQRAPFYGPISSSPIFNTYGYYYTNQFPNQRYPNEPQIGQQFYSAEMFIPNNMNIANRRRNVAPHQNKKAKNATSNSAKKNDSNQKAIDDYSSDDVIIVDKFSDDNDDNGIIGNDRDNFSDKQASNQQKNSSPKTAPKVSSSTSQNNASSTSKIPSNDDSLFSSTAASPNVFPLQNSENLKPPAFDPTSLPIDHATLSEKIKSFDKSLDHAIYQTAFECIKKYGTYGSRFYAPEFLIEIGKTLFVFAYCRLSVTEFNFFLSEFNKLIPNILRQILKTPFKEFIDNEFLSSLFKGKEKEFVIEVLKRDRLFRIAFYVTNEKLPKNFQFAPEVPTPIGWTPIRDYLILRSSFEKFPFNRITINKLSRFKKWIFYRIEFISKEVSVLIPDDYDKNIYHNELGDFENFKNINNHVIYPQKLSISFQKKLLRIFYLYGIPKKDGIEKIKIISKSEILFNDKNEDLILIFAVKILIKSIKYKPDLFKLLESLKSIGKSEIDDDSRVDICWIKEDAIKAVASNLDLIFKVREFYSTDLNLSELPEWTDIKKQCNWWNSTHDEILFKVTAFYGFLFNSMLCKFIPSENIDDELIIHWRNKEMVNLEPIKNSEMNYLGNVLSFEKKKMRIIQILDFLKSQKSNP